MTGKPGASGGTREGAGRPLVTYKGNQYVGNADRMALART
jgi:hypothetical protein